MKSLNFLLYILSFSYVMYIGVFCEPSLENIQEMVLFGVIHLSSYFSWKENSIIK